MRLEGMASHRRSRLVPTLQPSLGRGMSVSASFRGTFSMAHIPNLQNALASRQGGPDTPDLPKCSWCEGEVSTHLRRQ